MKNVNKGFLLPLVLVLIGIIVLGGGVYYSIKVSSPTPEETPGTNNSTTTPDTNTEEDTNIPEDTSNTVSLKTYTNTTNGFEVKYPEELAVSEVSSYQVLKAGTSFVFPTSYRQGTNFLQGRVHIETQTMNGSCSPSLFIGEGGKEAKVLPSILKNNMVFTGASSAEGAAGSTYTQTVYSTGANGKCYGIILYTQVGNLGAYGPETKAYDAVKIDAVFQGMISTFKVI